MPTIVIPTPFGRSLVVEADDEAIVEAEFRSVRAPARAPANALLREARAQVNAYCARKLRHFDLPLRFAGTDFECKVWRAVAALGFGDFVAYGEVARAVGEPLAQHGVARAMGRTPIDLFVPAHRVIGADGRLKGCAPRSMRAKLFAFERVPKKAKNPGRAAPRS
ncbi:MAG: methylated-DNA--[protein]-cysteine S-methyltransferase [Candidatus Eremiobacteraeota bacterium]|nr:methylated-DNA--[protein]-cysteine S-methyltransferase [Candidatus Eremiobacteraeota bacterium]